MNGAEKRREYTPTPLPPLPPPPPPPPPPSLVIRYISPHITIRSLGRIGIILRLPALIFMVGVGEE
jgi:hypothetical protein